MTRPLLAHVQGLLQRTWRIRLRGLDAGRFVIGDRGYRRLYGGARRSLSTGAPQADARTLIRETPEGLRAAVYYPDELIRRLERHPPQHGVGDCNVDAFATLVEELDHLLCVAEAAAASRPVSLFELELHANVSKYLVLLRFLAGRRRRVEERERVWLRYHLFEKVRFSDEDESVRERYRDAARWAVRLLSALESFEPPDRIATLRRFHDTSQAGKLRLIERLAA